MKPNGGPAYPRPSSEDRRDGDQPDGNVRVPHQDGVSVRAYYAAKALQGVLANDALLNRLSKEVSADNPFPVARFCLSQADGLLQEYDR